MTTTTAGLYPDLMEAIRAIRAVCDGAHRNDGVGFTVQHARLGKELAARSEWTHDLALEAYHMLATYQHTQLPGFGIDYDADLLCPVRSDQDVKWRPMTNEERREAFPAKKVFGSVQLKDGQFVVRFPYEPTFVDKVRSMKGRTWNNPHRQAWTVEPNFGNVTILLTMVNGWDMTPEVVDLMHQVNEAGPTREDLPPEFNIELERDEDGEPKLWIMTWDREDSKFDERKSAVKAVTGRRWDAKLFRWTAPVSSTTATEIQQVVQDTGMDISEEALAVAHSFEERADALLLASRLDDADLEVEGLAPGLELMPFQRAGVAFGMAVPRFILGDEMGLGKTIQALALLQKRRSYPALVICPASVKLQWVEELTKWLPGITVDYLRSRNDYGLLTQPDVLVVNYDLLITVGVKDADGTKVLDPKTGKQKRENSNALESVLNLDWEAVVVDELHYVKNPKAHRTVSIKKIVKRLADDAPVMLLSGTPIKSRPAELVEPLKIIGVFDTAFGGWSNFVRTYCGAYQNNFGWNATGASNLTELGDKLRSTCMIRRLKKEVQSELPEKTRVRTVVEMTTPGKYRKAEDDVIAYYAERKLQDKDFVATLEGLTTEEKDKARNARRLSVAYKARQAEALVRINALRGLVGELKVKAVIAWVKDWLEVSEGKLVMFAHHTRVQKALAEAFGDQAVALRGGMDAMAKKRAVSTFMEDPDVRVFVASLGAGGVGIDGLQRVADTVAFVEYAWTPGEMQQAEDRVHRMFQDSDSVVIHHFVAVDTIDVDFQETLAAKQLVLDAVLGDGDNEEQAAKARGANVFGAIERALRAKAEGV
jgi:hypothetical protein